MRFPSGLKSVDKNELDRGSLKQQPATQTLKRLLPFLARYQGRILLAGVALLVAAGATLSMPLALRYLIDQGFSASTLEAGDVSVNRTFLLFFCLSVLLALGTAVRFYCVAWLGERVMADIRSAVYAQVLKQDPVFFETLKTGEVLSRLSSDTTLIQTLIGTSISLGLRNTLLFVGALGLMIYTSPSLSLVIVALLLVVVLPILLLGKRVRSLSRDSQDRLADTGALAGETLGAMQVVQAYGREELESGRYENAANQAFQSAIRRNRSRAGLTALAIILIFGSIVFVLWLGANAVLSGEMSAGLLTQFMLYAALVGGSLGVISEVFGDVQRAAGATERLLELLESEPTISSGDSALAIPPAEHVSAQRGVEVAFENVSFYYPSRPEEPALENVSFQIAAGETVALVGPSGAGKTTVLQLILRFYDPQSGGIRMGGQNTVDLTLESLRSAIGLVSQDSIVFSASAMDNIRYGNLSASDEDVVQAAQYAQAHEFIQRLPDGYDTYLGERGVRLSGGQRQRISIARALLKNPPLLLLDEATSSLDAESERKVQVALDRAMSNRTTLVIAHRLATVVDADRILVLEQGRIVETGSHKDLLAAGGSYAEIAAMQFNGN
ncbi:MAG: ATP-binding cassette domain-containing protein [Granulosicoccus sp.]|nr:ATP-binding cassette domain-containing protein [Granulosicoccus sp.]